MNLPVRLSLPEDPSPVETLSALLATELAATETVIAERMESPVGLIPDVAHHLVDAGGKRLRPLLTLAAAKACGGGGEAAVKLAAAVEYIHTATLLHDDVVDGSSLRRGRRAANLIWGEKASVLVGDFLFARAFNLMVETGSMEVLDILAHASSVIAEGEVMQLAATARGDASRSSYNKVIEAKTAALFRAATQSGAVAAGADRAAVSAFATYGLELGLAFQLVDDALDYGGLTQELGKNIGDDFREGKATFPVIIALERANDEERTFWQRVLAKKHGDEDLTQALQIIRRRGGVEATLQEAATHVAAARAALETLDLTGPDSEQLIDVLGHMASQVLSRGH